MFRSRITRALAIAGAAFALVVSGQAPASAGTANWTTNFNIYDNKVCTSLNNLLNSNTYIATCLQWETGVLQGYTIVTNTGDTPSYLPNATTDVFLFNTTGNTCAVGIIPAQSIRACYGPVRPLATNAGCSTLAAYTGYYWYEDKTQFSPAAYICT